MKKEMKKLKTIRMIAYVVMAACLMMALAQLAKQRAWAQDVAGGGCDKCNFV